MSQSRKTPFAQSSYAAQVRRLRGLAVLALRRFRVSVRAIHFIHHGENATFRIVDTRGRKFLLRIHRGGYHTPDAIREELSWLSLLARKDLPVPEPVRSKGGQLVETVVNADFPEGRQCCMFKWIEGRFIDRSVNREHMFNLGRLIAQIQMVQPSGGVRHRRYWTAEGLLGLKSKFGSLKDIYGIRKSQRDVLEKCRRSVLRKLLAYQKRDPRRLRLIHADPHFGNLLNTSEGMAAIDFDDCGLGFYAYDLAVALSSARECLGKARRERMPELKEALIAGYSTLCRWDEEDERILALLIHARGMMAVGWLNSRRENPRLRKHLRPILKRTILMLKTNPVL